MRQLPYRWQCYADAWTHLVGSAVRTSQQFEGYVLKAAHSSWSCEVDLKAFFVRELPREKVQYLGRLAKQIVEVTSMAYRPPWESEAVATRARVKAFWREMKRIRFSAPAQHEALHLYVIARLQQPAKWIKPYITSKYIYNTSERCCLCFGDELETMQHAYIECHVARQLKTAFAIDYDYALLSTGGLLKADDPDPLHLALLAKYIYTLHTLIRRRRLGNSPPLPITAAHIEQIAIYGIEHFHG